MFVVDHLGLEAREQSKLIAAKGVYSQDNVRLVARVIRQFLGESFVLKMKYALDSMNSCVYVLVPDDEVAALMASQSFEVEFGQTMSFHRILSFEVRSEEDDHYQSVQVRMLWPCCPSTKSLKNFKVYFGDDDV